jgi:dihydroorotase
MLTTMSKFLHAGLSIREVVSAATERPAAAIHRDHEIGSLRVGRRADIAVFRVESGSFEFTDAYGRVERGSRRFVPVLTVMDGSIVMPSDVTIKLRPFTGGDHEVNCGAPLVSSPAPM